jgi:phage tail sheath protein FI
MPQYLSPGVYIEEIKPSAQSIAGVGTSIAGFIGLVFNDVEMAFQPNSTTNKYSVATADVAKLITSWEEFKRNFGDFQAKKAAWETADYDAYLYLQHALYGFFRNGGTRCWVLRVAALTELTTATELDSHLNTLAAIDEIAIVAVPGATSTAQHQSILNHCFNLKDRFAVLDGVRNPAPEQSEKLSDDIAASNGRSESGSFGAVYYPWIKVASGNSTIAIPPSGHITGIYARNDNTRGVFKTPANEEILGALDVDKLLSKADQDGLNPEGINVIRVLNSSIRVWGGRTRADEANSQFRYISTRRFLSFLYESIDEGTQFAVFEPNTPALWQRITQSLTNFLLNQWRDGALFGTSPEEAFFVKCDKDTNPPEVRELGQVIAEIGVAIVKPAEFVIFRIQQTTGG